MSAGVDSGTSGRETHEFQAEVGQVLSLVINSLYSHREIFLRELISNASDALDRLRYAELTDHDLADEDVPREVRIAPDPEAGTLTVEDFGIGMTREEVMENLGTVAHSGTRAFMAAMKEGKAETDEVDLIGQFGVGFYSAYLVAERVDVITRAAGPDATAWRWSSDAKDRYTLEPAERETHGTAVVLHLRPEEKEFLEPWRLRGLIQRYSDYISHPIRLLKREEKEGDEAPEETWEKVNTASALWRRPKSEIDEDDYAAFYQHLAHDVEGPLTHTHFTVEGTRLFTGLLFVPKRPPFDLFSPEPRHGVRLYVKRVFIMDDCREILPRWLRFVRGVVDSDDLPLNVSRETLQDSAVVRFIRKHVTRKALEMIEGLAEQGGEEWETFWDNYGVVLKEGFHLAPEHVDRLAKLLRFRSSHAEGWTSLADYVERMPEGQESIYYATGTSIEAAEASPHLEALRAKGYEVLYLTDPIDEWVLMALPTFEDKPLVSAMKADLDLEPEDEEAKEEREARTEALGGLMKRFEEVLGDEIAEVRASSRLTDSPTCLVVPEGGLHAHVERLLRATDQGMGAPQQKRILELNPNHPFVERLRSLHDEGADEVDDWIRLLFEQALLAEGSPVEDPAGFADRLKRVMARAMGVPEAPAGG
ncbi:MAG: molecular chaperone HtpG [Myxococcota bacterium]